MSILTTPSMTSWLNCARRFMKAKVSSKERIESSVIRTLLRIFKRGRSGFFVVTKQQMTLLLLNFITILQSWARDVDCYRKSQIWIMCDIGYIFVFLQVGKLALAHNKRLDHDEITPVVMKPWIFPSQLPPEAAHCNIAGWPHIAAWITSLHADHGTVQHWSWLRLSADLHQLYPDCGPSFNQKQLRWKSKNTMPNALFVKRNRWLTTYLMNLAKAVGITMPVQYRSPNSHATHYWLNTLPVQVSHERQSMPDAWLQQWRPCYNTSRQLRATAWVFIWKTPGDHREERPGICVAVNASRKKRKRVFIWVYKWVL